MSDDEFDYDEPWPLFADEDEPWKDRERLFRLLNEMPTQKHVGDALGCSPSTIGYWKGKFEDQIVAEAIDEDSKCEYYDVCENETPGGLGEICDLCLDLARKASHGDVGPHSDDAAERIAWLYDHYDEYVTAFREQRKAEAEEDETPDCTDCDEPMVPVGEIDAHLCTECGATA